MIMDSRDLKALEDGPAGRGSGPRQHHDQSAANGVVNRDSAWRGNRHRDTRIAETLRQQSARPRRISNRTNPILLMLTAKVIRKSYGLGLPFFLRPIVLYNTECEARMWP